MLFESRHLSAAVEFDVQLAGETTADTTKLAQIVKTTFLLAMDPRPSLGQRAILGSIAKELRERLRMLLSERFKAGTPFLVAANREIVTTNRYLEDEAAKLEKIADTIEQLGKLVAAVDKLVDIIA